VGLAVSDDDGLLATPLCTVPARGEGDPAKRIAAEAAREGCEEIIVGLPRNLDGTEGAAARKSRLLAGRIHLASGLRVVLWDERLTTAEAHRALGTVEMSERDRRGVVDQVAATILLQSYLDARAARKREALAKKRDKSAAVGQTESEWSRSSEDAANAASTPAPDASGRRGAPGARGVRSRRPR
jgi:putative Holliday junction resolvase